MKQLMLAAALLVVPGIQAGELMLDFHGNGMAGKQVRIAVYSARAPEQFPSDERCYRCITQEAASDRLTLTIADLPSGKYAVAVYVDDNQNGRHDKNLLGIPQEKYGFSNDARSIFGPPGFSAALFDIGETARTQSIHIH